MLKGQIYAYTNERATCSAISYLGHMHIYKYKLCLLVVHILSLSLAVL